MAGRFLATEVVPSLDGLSTRFAQGGAFLDVGVGVGELASASCSDLPGARVVGLDPFPLALELARKTIEARGLVDRIELRPHGVEELSADREFDLAWLPTPFIPRQAVELGLSRIFDALVPGGWLLIGGALWSPGSGARPQASRPPSPAGPRSRVTNGASSSTTLASTTRASSTFHRAHHGCARSGGHPDRPGAGAHTTQACDAARACSEKLEDGTVVTAPVSVPSWRALERHGTLGTLRRRPGSSASGTVRSSGVACPLAGGPGTGNREGPATRVHEERKRRRPPASGLATQRCPRPS